MQGCGQNTRVHEDGCWGARGSYTTRTRCNALKKIPGKEETITDVVWGWFSDEHGKNAGRVCFVAGGCGVDVHMEDQAQSDAQMPREAKVGAR